LGAGDFPIDSYGKRAQVPPISVPACRHRQGVGTRRQANWPVLFALPRTHGWGADPGATDHADDPHCLPTRTAMSMTTAHDDHLDLLTAAEVAAVLHVGVRTAIRKLDAAGVPSVRIGNKLRYWRRAAVVAFIAGCETGGSSHTSTPRRGRPTRPSGMATTPSLTPSERRTRAARVAHVLGPARPRPNGQEGSDG